MKNRDIITFFGSYIEPSSDIILFTSYISYHQRDKKYDVMCSNLCSDLDECYLKTSIIHKRLDDRLLRNDVLIRKINLFTNK